MNEQPWLQFRHDIVRQLAFCIASPPLLQAWPDASTAIDLPDQQFWLQHFQQYLPRLLQLDHNPQPLLQHVQQLRSTRLGIRFEGLLGFWLQDHAYHPYQLVGQSIKRMDGSRTLGELDFVLLNRETGQREHWEVAIKFYLGEASFFADQWVGLNRRDTLGRKLKHLQQNQFSLTGLKDIQVDVQRAIVKGRLFYPCHQKVELPGWIAADHLNGIWGHYPPALTDNGFWRRASRPEWLTESGAISSQTANPQYWADGLYFFMQENRVKTRYMLRANNLIHKSPYNRNSRILNPHRFHMCDMHAIS